ncbi:MAG: acyltransferase [Clostridia bacterium]|nr:acyltransferase [Clostridia bacterium]
MNNELRKEDTSFITFLRGIAIVTVVFSHLIIRFWNNGVVDIWPFLATQTPVSGLSAINVSSFLDRMHLEAGPVGVALFYLISGFLVNMSLKRYTICKFLLMRVFRIFPLYIIGFSITFGCIWLYTSQSGIDFPYTFTDWLTQVSLLRQFLWMPSIDGISWTLVADIELYFLMAFLAILKKNESGKAVIITSASITAISMLCSINNNRFLMNAQYGLFKFSNVFRIAAFCMTFMLIGVVIYEHFSKKWNTAKTVFVGSFVYVMFVVCSLSYAPDATNQICSYTFSLAVFVLCYIFSQAGYGSRFEIPLISFIAKISYPMYLIHGLNGYILLTALYRAGVNNYLSLLITLVCATLLACGLHYGVEVPLLKATKRKNLK